MYLWMCVCVCVCVRCACGCDWTVDTHTGPSPNKVTSVIGPLQHRLSSETFSLSWGRTHSDELPLPSSFNSRVKPFFKGKKKKRRTNRNTGSVQHLLNYLDEHFGSAQEIGISGGKTRPTCDLRSVIGRPSCVLGTNIDSHLRRTIDGYSSQPLYFFS